MKKIKYIISNKVLQYVISRYFVYFIQFINSLLIASYLGPFYLGVWGFVNLIIQYFEQFNFGLSQSFNALGAIYKEDEKYVSRLFGTTLLCIGIIGCLSALFFCLNNVFQWGIGDKYQFNKYSSLVMFIVLLNYFIPAFLSLLRIYGDIITIILVQSIQPIFIFILLHFWKGQNLLDVLIWILFVSSFISIVFCLVRSPISIRFKKDYKILKSLLRKAIYLFLYSASFYFILLSTRGLISANFSVEQFGYFTFAFSLGNAILLLFKSFTFLIFPKVINRLAHAEGDEAMKIVDKARIDYVTLAHIIGYLAILVFPFFIILFPKFINTIIVFNLIILSLILYTHCFGYQELLIAKGKDRLLGVIALISLTVNVIIAVVLIYVIKVSYEYVVFSTLIAYLVFMTLLVVNSNIILGHKISLAKVMSVIFPLRLLIPFVISLGLIIQQASTWYYVLPILLFLIINWKYMVGLKTTFVNVLNNPNLTNI